MSAVVDYPKNYSGSKKFLKFPAHAHIWNSISDTVWCKVVKSVRGGAEWVGRSGWSGAGYPLWPAPENNGTRSNPLRKLRSIDLWFRFWAFIAVIRLSNPVKQLFVSLPGRRRRPAREGNWANINLTCEVVIGTNLWMKPLGRFDCRFFWTTATSNRTHMRNLGSFQETASEKFLKIFEIIKSIAVQR